MCNVCLFIVICATPRHFNDTSINSDGGRQFLRGVAFLAQLTLSLPRVISHNILFQSLTKDISYSMENLAFDSLLR